MFMGTAGLPGNFIWWLFVIDAQPTSHHPFPDQTAELNPSLSHVGIYMRHFYREQEKDGQERARKMCKVKENQLSQERERGGS